jgi:predicted short-subunit dehydrogenase-like oxidoreductase (DUF2520 family)
VSEPGGDRLRIVGAGRVGLALGLALHRAGALAALEVSGRRAETPDHPLFGGVVPPARYRMEPAAVAPGTTGVILAVPDRALPQAAARLASVELPEGVPVLHTGGALGAEVLAPLRERGAVVGSLHPLAAVPDPVLGAERLRGATWGVEAEGAALALAERIVRACAGRLLQVAPGGKPLYHAAAVFASNYAVVLLGVAERLMEEAGVPAAEARRALGALAQGAVMNVAERGPAAALTGPVARGDDGTVALHLSRLSTGLRPLYSLLGREALALARAAGLDPAAAERVEAALEEDAAGPLGVQHSGLST